MRVIKIQRTIRSELKRRRSIRQCTRDFFAKENNLEFAIEAIAFGTLLAISAWPIVAVADAINRFL